jgi:CheY-like chemotaxis protein
VVHAIMKNHKGAIVVESSPGSGTSFSLYFPAAGVDVARPKEGKRRIPGAALAPFGQGRKIMLVDDEDAVRSIGSKLLGRLGFVPEVYERPVEALNAFRAASCDYCALISDLTMPEMTGLELAKQILAIRPGLPVILTSGHFQAEVRQEAIDSGVQSLVNKPFEIQELVSRIRLVLNEPVSEVA